MKFKKSLINLAILSSSMLMLGNVYAVDESRTLVHATSDVKQGDLSKSASHVQVFEYGDYVGISYGLFYPHNGDIFLSQGSGGDLGDVICALTPWLCGPVDWVAGDEGVHEGDWENVKVIINKNSQSIEEVYISAHEGEGGWFPLSNFSIESNRPVVYSALHSHANYRTSGLQARIEETFGVANDQTDRGELWQLKDHISLIGSDYATNNQYAWVEYNGRWGATFDEGFSGTNSPGGKKFSKNWFVNWVEDEEGINISTGNLTDLVQDKYADAKQLAYDYAPRVYLHSDEQYMPSSVPWYLDRVQLEVDDNVTLDTGEVNPWTVVGKNAPLLPDLSLFSKNKGLIEATNEKYNDQNVWKVSTEGVDGYLQGINAGATFTPDNKVYEFSVALKAEPGTTQLVTLRLRDKESENIKEQDFTVTDQWQTYSVNQGFPGTHSGLSMFIYPAGKVAGNNGYVYAADAKLDRIVTYTKTLAGLRWGKNNSRVGEGRCSLNGQLLSTGVISEECAEKGRYYTWQEAQTACPVNYRLPTVSEYLALFDATGGANDTAGRQLKSVGFGNGTNEHSFNAIATGWANAGSTTLTNTNIETAFWTADENAANNTEAARVFLQENNSQIPWSPTFYANRDKNKRYSVRCVK